MPALPPPPPPDTSPIPAIPPSISIRPGADGGHTISLAPNVQITALGAPPNPWAVLLSAVPDLAAIVMFGVIGHLERVGYQAITIAIMGILYLRVKAVEPGQQATSGIAGAVQAADRGVRTIIGAIRTIIKKK